MKKSLKIAAVAALLTILILIISLKLFFKPIIETAIQTAGFEKAKLESADFGFSTSTLKNIKLDDSGTVIGEMKVVASPGDAARRTAQEIYLSGVRISWPLPIPSPSDEAGPLNIFTKYAQFSDVEITVATPMGPMPVKLQGSIEDTGATYKVNAIFKADTAFAKFVGKVVGVVGRTSRRAKLSLEIANGSLTLPDIEMLGASGSLTADFNPAQPMPQIKGKLTVSAMKLSGVPLEGTTLTFDPKPENTRVVLQGAVINGSGNVLADLQVDHTDKTLDRMNLSIRAELKDLSALEVVDMGGTGSIILSMTGEHLKGKPWGDLAEWKNMTGSSGIALQKLSLPGVVSGAEALAAFSLSLDPATQQLSMKASDGAVTFGGKLRTLGNRFLSLDIPLNNDRPPTIVWDNKTKVMILDFLGATATSLGFTASKVDATLNVSLDEYISVGGTVDIGELKQLAPPPERYFVPVRAALRLESSKSVTAFSGQISERNGKFSAAIQGQHKGKEGKGSITLKMPPTNFAQPALPVSAAFPFTQYYFTDAFGTVGLSANYTWNRDAKGRWTIGNNGQLYLKDVTATVKDNVITGINTVMNLESLVPPVIRQQAVAVGGVNVGLPLTDGLAMVSVDQTKDKMKSTIFTLHSAEWSAVGGRITSSPFAMRFDEMTANFTLTAKALDMQQMLEIAPLDGLSADGKADGIIPVRVEKGRFSIENGNIQTTAPGTIRYNPQNVPAFLQNPSQKQIIDLKAALTAFNYESLGLTINGELGKSQQVSMKIKGRNPLFYGGKPVNFNLNVEGPLSNLVKSYPGSSRIPDSIRKLMEVYEASNAKQ